eukprot:8128359-Pyramimonas_sp.AAC.1
MCPDGAPELSNPVPLPPPWNAVLDRMVEFQLAAPAHYNSARNNVTQLDRSFCSAPGWLLSQNAPGGE